MSEKLKASGHLKIVLINELGQIVQQGTFKNLITTAGKSWLAERQVATPAALSHMAVGTSSTAPTAGDLTLATEVARVALDSASFSGNVTTYVATFPPGVATGAIVEAGLLNAATNGMLFNRLVFGIYTKGANDTMVMTWEITQN